MQKIFNMIYCYISVHYLVYQTLTMHELISVFCHLTLNRCWLCISVLSGTWYNNVANVLIYQCCLTQVIKCFLPLPQFDYGVLFFLSTHLLKCVPLNFLFFITFLPPAPMVNFSLSKENDEEDDEPKSTTKAAIVGAVVAFLIIGTVLLIITFVFYIHVLSSLDFWVTKEFCDSMFSSIAPPQKILFFWETKKFYVFYAFWTHGQNRLSISNDF